MIDNNDKKINKRLLLEKFEDQIQNLESSPLYDYRIKNDYKPVIGEGDPDAKIMFIGEAPGAQEAQTGKPFVGRAGKLLDELLNSINLERNKVYITNIVKDRPPSNRMPLADEIELYSPFLLEQIKIIKPKIIATLGRLAMKFILRTFNIPLKNRSIGDLHGEIFYSFSDSREIIIYPLYHPAAVFYNRKLEDVLKDDFYKLRKILMENL